MEMRPFSIASIAYGTNIAVGFFAWLLVFSAVFNNRMWATPVVLSLVVAMVAGALCSAFWIVLLPDSALRLAVAYAFMPTVFGGLGALSFQDASHLRDACFFLAIPAAMCLSSLCGGWLTRKCIRSSFLGTMITNDDSDSDAKRLLKLCLRHMRGVATDESRGTTPERLETLRRSRRKGRTGSSRDTNAELRQRLERVAGEAEDEEDK